MKILLLATFLLGASIASAQTTFPGLKSVLSEAEWKRAGLDRLSPAEIGVIDAALGRHESGATATLQTDLNTARETAAAAKAEAEKAAAAHAAALAQAAEAKAAEAKAIAAQSAAEAQAKAAAAAATAPVEAEHRRSLMQRFGLPLTDEAVWRSTPPLKATVVAWESANRFKLDNGQIWEGAEPITYELLNQSIEIHARPHGQFALIVNGKNTKLRVIRVR